METASSESERVESDTKEARPSRPASLSEMVGFCDHVHTVIIIHSSLDGPHTPGLIGRPASRGQEECWRERTVQDLHRRVPYVSVAEIRVRR
jgi:hypothetical protein